MAELLYKKSTENIPFRIRIIAVDKNGYPGEDLLRESVVIDSYNIGQWNTFYLNERNIYIDHINFFIGIEWLNQPNTNGALQIGLTDKLKKRIVFIDLLIGNGDNLNLLTSLNRRI